MKHLILAILLAMTMHNGASAETNAELASRSAALLPQSGDGGDIRSLFNENLDSVRLMVLLSPT